MWARAGAPRPAVLAAIRAALKKGRFIFAGTGVEDQANRVGLAGMIVAAKTALESAIETTAAKRFCVARVIVRVSL
jgi:hypothetical protein